MICFFKTSAKKKAQTFYYFFILSFSLENHYVKADEKEEIITKIHEKQLVINSMLKKTQNFKTLEKYKFKIQWQKILQELLNLSNIKFKIMADIDLQLKNIQADILREYNIVAKKMISQIFNKKARQILDEDEYIKGSYFLMKIFKGMRNRHGISEIEKLKIQKYSNNLKIEGLFCFLEIITSKNNEEFLYFDMNSFEWILSVFFYLEKSFLNNQNNYDGIFNAEMLNLISIVIVVTEANAFRKIKLEYYELSAKAKIDENAMTQVLYNTKTNIIFFENKTKITESLITLRDIISCYKNFVYFCVNMYFSSYKLNDSILFDQKKIENIKTQTVLKDKFKNDLITDLFFNTFNTIYNNTKKMGLRRNLDSECRSVVALLRNVYKLKDLGVFKNECINGIIFNLKYKKYIMTSYFQANSLQKQNNTVFLENISLFLKAHMQYMELSHLYYNYIEALMLQNA